MFQTLIFSLLLSFGFFASVQSSLAVTLDVTPIKVAPHSYYVRGEAGLASSANEGFMSNLLMERESLK